MAITPRLVEVPQGERQRFELVDPRKRIQNPRWSIEGSGVSIEPQADGKAAQVSVEQDAELGERKVVVEGEGGQRLEAILEVTEQAKTDAFWIRIGDCVYGVELVEHSLPLAAQCLPAPKGQRGRRMLIDPSHSCLQDKKAGGKKAHGDLNALIPFMLLAHLRQLEEEGEYLGSAEAISQRLMELLQKLREEPKTPN